MNKSNETLAAIMAAMTDKTLDKVYLSETGVTIGQLYTDKGLPIDMSLSRLDMSKNAKLLVLHGACEWLIEHKRRSGATDKAVERQRKANRTSLERFVKTGEVGLY